jgi:hypothetical protein
MTLKNQNFMHEETNSILGSGKALYHLVQKLLSSVRNEGLRESLLRRILGPTKEKFSGDRKNIS